MALLTIAAVSAGDTNETVMTSTDDSPNELSQANEKEIINQKTMDGETGAELLGADEATYTELKSQIGNGGDINITKKRYTYTTGDGNTIKINTSGVINGNGAIIDMNGSNMRAFYVTVSGVTIKNLTIQNANYYGHGSAIYFINQGTVENCNFTCNNANAEGGAIWIFTGSVANCNFASNSAEKGANIYSLSSGSTADTCIFKTEPNNYNVLILAPTLNVDNSTIYKSNETLTFDLRTNSSIPVANGIISIRVYHKNNNSWIANYTSSSGKGWIIDLPEGSYYAIFNTEYEGFTPVNKSIKVIKNIEYYANVTPISSNNLSVNITAKSNIPQDIVGGKLLFILPNGTEINATYASNGIWWAVHSFDDYGDYQINASYIGLDNVVVNNATITVKAVDLSVNITSDKEVYFIGDNVVWTITVHNAGNGTDVTGVLLQEHFPSRHFKYVTCFTNNSTYNNESQEWDIGFMGNGTEATLYIVAYAIASGEHVENRVVVFCNEYEYDWNIWNNIAYNYVDVLKLNSTVDVNGTTLDYGKAVNITVVTEGAIGITAKINGENATVEGNTIIIPILNAGTYNLTVTTIPDEDYNPATKTVNVTVNKIESQVTSQGLTTDYQNNNYLVVNIKDSQGNPIANADANITINGVTYKCRTDNNGNAQLIIRLNPKTYIATVTFEDENHNKKTITTKVVVKKATPKITAKKKTFKKSKKVKKYVVTLKDNLGKPIIKAKLTLKVKGKTYKAKTNAKGKAVFKIKKLIKKGKYKATVTFKCNAYYTKATKKVKIIVK